MKGQILKPARLPMRGGAVNRQPRYRARNLQRRGFLRPRGISLSPTSFLEDPGSNLEFSIFFKIFKNFQVSGRFIWTWNNSAHSLCMKLRFCMSSAKTYFSNAIFYIENEFRNFPGERKIYSKILVNCRPRIIVFFLPGVLLTESSSPLQVMCSGAVNRQPGYRARTDRA